MEPAADRESLGKNQEESDGSSFLNSDSDALQEITTGNSESVSEKDFNQYVNKRMRKYAMYTKKEIKLSTIGEELEESILGESTVGFRPLPESAVGEESDEEIDEKLKEVNETENDESPSKKLMNYRISEERDANYEKEESVNVGANKEFKKIYETATPADVEVVDKVEDQKVVDGDIIPSPAKTAANSNTRENVDNNLDKVLLPEENVNGFENSNSKEGEDLLNELLASQISIH